MNSKFSVTLSDSFIKNAKRLIKKYPSLKNEIVELITSLEINPTQGTDLGNNCYKIRLAIKSKNTGKSGGARIISFVKFTDTKVILLTIYDKSDKNTITDKELINLINKALD